MTAPRLGLLLAAGLLVAAAPPQRTADAARYPGPRVEEARADTLHARVRAGETLIVALPAAPGGAEATYRAVEAPALSWLVDRSFMWKTLAAERGELAVVFERRGGLAPEEVVLLVEITP